MKKIIIIIIAALFVAVSLKAEGIDVKGAVDRAEALAKKGKYDEAINELEDHVPGAASIEQEMELLAERGKIKLIAGRFSDAITDIDFAIRTAPKNPCLKATRAEMYEMMGETKLARMDAESVLSAGCDLPILHAIIGRSYFRDNDMLKAIDHFALITKDETLKPDALGMIGEAYFVMGYPSVAAEFLNESLKLEPDNGFFQSELADALSLTGDAAGAIEHYEKAIKTQPDNSIASNNYAFTLFLDGKTDKALSILDDINNKNPSPYSLCSSMEIHLFKNNLMPAMLYGRFCLSVFDKKPEMRDGDKYYVDAVKYAVETIQTDRLSLHPLTQIDLARQSLANGERKDAASAYFLALMLDPKNQDATFELGKLLVAQGETVKGFMILNSAISLAGKNSPTGIQAKSIIDKESADLFGNGATVPMLSLTADKD